MHEVARSYGGEENWAQGRKRTCHTFKTWVRWRRSGGGRAARTRERLRLTMARVLPAVGGAAHARGGEEQRWGQESGERTPTHMSHFQNYGVHDLSLNLVFKIYHELPYFITIIPLI